jgi:hypothetical protein
VKDSNLLATFTSEAELGVAIRKTVGSYIDDALLQARSGPEVLLKADAQLSPGALEWWPFELEEEDIIDATCYGDKPFYATFVDSDGFVRLHNNPRGRGLGTGTQKSAHHFQKTIDSEGTFYLMLRCSSLATGLIAVNLRVVRR